MIDKSSQLMQITMPMKKNLLTKICISRFLPVLIWAVVIFAFSADPVPYKILPISWSSPTISATHPTQSKAEELGRVLHIGEYTILSLLMMRGLIWHRPVNTGLVMSVLGLTTLYALSDEIHQLFVPGRAFEFADLARDAFGAILGIFLYLLINRLIMIVQQNKIRIL